jgi:predicted GNAT family acetyltransferase
VGIKNVINVIHQSQNQQFVVQQDGQEAVLTYRLFDTNQIDFHSTFVPPEFRGQGIAEKLVRTGIAWAKEQGYELHASCWYAAKFL